MTHHGGRRAAPAWERLLWLALWLALLLAAAVCGAGWRPAAAVSTAFTLPRQGQLDNSIYLPVVAGPQPAHVVIAAAYIDSAVSHEPDEAVLLWNTGGTTQTLAGWQIASGARQAMFSEATDLALGPGERLWCAAQATAFRASFGRLPACEWSADTDPSVANLEGAVTFNNRSGAITLRAADGALADTLVYGEESRPFDGWHGPPAQVYTRGSLSAAGQVWQRKLDPSTGWPIDHDTAADWAGDLADTAWGRRVRQPGWEGWDAAGWLWPAAGAADATVAAAVGPEGLYQPIADRITAAKVSIYLSAYTFEHPDLANLLAAAARRGVAVRVLLDGSPPGGITPLQKWCVQQIAAAGGDLRYSAVNHTAPPGYKKRYRYVHAKYAVIDHQAALVGTENWTRDAMPAPTAIPTGGRRGAYLFTDAPLVVQALESLFSTDWAPDRFFDLQPYQAGDDHYGAPPAGFTPPPPVTYTVPASPFPHTVSATGRYTFMVVSTPENALRPDSGLHALIARAGPGDEITVMQLYEHKYWGDSGSNPIADPNVRLESLIAAARRGARVRLLLDSFFDEEGDLRGNQATAAYVRAVAAAGGGDIDARTGNPTAGGIHAKILLLQVGGETWSAVGSLNGGEVSYKQNREVVLMVNAPAVYTYLRAVFEHDWALGK